MSVQAAPGRLAEGFRIGPVLVDPPVVLAPMADVTNGAYRRICRRIGGPGLLCTEQISTQALHYGSARTYEMFDWTNEDRPLSVQIFGADPAIVAEAARVVVDAGADIVDINMGCWVPKVCRQGAGAALLRDQDTALRVVEAVVAAVGVPVTVKMRAGWTADCLTSAPLARRFEGAGVQAFALHGRTAEQGFEGAADWQWIADVRHAVSVPVIGNGDVRTPADALRMLRSTGCHGVMVGRAAIGNPWALRDIGHYLRTGELLPPPDIEERRATAMVHLEALAERMGERLAVCHLRGQLPQYVRGIHGASRARERIMHATRVEEVREILADVSPHECAD